MRDSISRRDFIAAGTTAAVAAALPMPLAGAPAVHARGAARPVVIASGNGNQYRNGGAMTAVQLAFTRIAAGADVLDAIVEGVALNELDPGDTSVGFGGLPNAEGVVQLDASVMHGPRRRAGAVAALEGVRTPAAVAKAVLENTDHHLIVVDDAQRFARQMGFTVEDDLNTPESRRLWLEWKRRVDPARYLDPATRAEAAHAAGLEMVAAGMIDPLHYYGTINCNAVNARGDVCGVTTTSGLAWKIPGRVGDSPILGAGLYVDNEVGAAGSTGRGEANLYNLTSYLVVESLRRGMSPKDAGMEGLRRIARNTVEKRLLNPRGTPNFSIQFYVLNARGEHAGVTMYPGGTYAVCDENGPRDVPLEPLFQGAPRD
jgi:N4-(beta-N-acetylglucosaminyl)-L-asparaginase